MSQYKHGSYAKENPTKLKSVISSTANISFVVGTAPINLVDETNVNRLCRLATAEEAIKQFGYSTDFTNYTLSEALQVFFNLYGVAPVYFVNVLDPKKHKKDTEPEVQPIINNQIVLSKLGALKSSVVVSINPPQNSTKAGVVKDTLAKPTPDKDYTLAFNNDGYLVLTVVDGGSITPVDTLKIEYSILDPSKVTSKDIIGGIDTAGNYSGIELAQKVKPKFNEIPGSLIANGYSQDLAVAQALLRNAKTLNSKFLANALIDLDTSKMVIYTDAVAVKQKANLVDPQINLTVGDLVSAGIKYNQSTHLAALKQLIAGQNDNVPNKNPSNKSYLIDGYLINGKEIDLDETQANYLNANGMILTINTERGWRCWGNRTACFPGNTDIKDFDIAIRDLGNWLINSIIINSAQMVDDAIDRGLVLRIENSMQSWLDGLAGSNKLISGSIEFPKEKNPLSELVSGNLVFVLDYCAGPTASSITTEIEFNVFDLNNKIFGE